MTTKKEIVVKKLQEVAVIDPELLAELNDMRPQEESRFSKISLPRIGYASVDKMEGEGNAKKVTEEAGTFFYEIATEETNAEGKKIFKREEIGKSMEGVILYHRHQLSYYDKKTEKYTSSPIYDTKDEVIPLWCDKQEVAKGTPDELRAKYAFVDEDGKDKCKLKDNRILYILHKEQLYQLALHGSSMFAFLSYVRKVNPATVLTYFDSEPKKKGKTKWQQMTFTSVRPLNNEELLDIRDKVREVKFAIQAEKGTNVEVATRYVAEEEKANKDFDALGGKGESIPF